MSLGVASRSRLRVVAWSTAAVLPLLPLIAMQFTDEVAWTGFDVALFAVMLAIAGGAIELAAWATNNGVYRAAVGVAVAAAFALVWLNGAVGIIGNEKNPANLMYGGVLAVAILGAVAARFRAAGMARAMLAAALAQVLVLVIALLAVPAPEAAKWPWDAIFLTAFFASLWLLSAGLFRRCDAARAPSA